MSDNPGEWWTTFFSGLLVDMWLAAMPEATTETEIDFLESALQPPPGGKLLDVPCGGGRHAVALAKRGFDVTGVDISSAFLDAARSRCVDLPAKLAWEQRDMRDLPWPGHFAGAYCFGNSFGYLDGESNADFLKAVARTLKPGAKFVLDTAYVTEILLPTLQERGWYEVGNVLTLSRRWYDHTEGRLHVEYTLIRDGEKEQRAMSARLYSYREIIHLLNEAGLGDVQAYGSLAKEPFKLGSQRLVLVATKENH